MYLEWVVVSHTRDLFCLLRQKNKEYLPLPVLSFSPPTSPEKVTPGSCVSESSPEHAVTFLWVCKHPGHTRAPLILPGHCAMIHRITNKNKDTKGLDHSTGLSESGLEPCLASLCMAASPWAYAQSWMAEAWRRVGVIPTFSQLKMYSLTSKKQLNFKITRQGQMKKLVHMSRWKVKIST